MFGNVWNFVIILELVRIIRIGSFTRLNLSITYRQTGRSGQMQNQFKYFEINNLKLPSNQTS